MAVAQAVEQAVVARGGGDELLEADLDDLERRRGARDHRAVGEQLDVDVVVADRRRRPAAGSRRGTRSA